LLIHINPFAELLIADLSQLNSQYVTFSHIFTRQCFNSLVSFNPEKAWKRRNSRTRDGMRRQRKPVMEWKKDARSKSLLSVGAMWSPSPLGCFWLELLFFPPRTMQVSLTFSRGGHPVCR